MPQLGRRPYTPDLTVDDPKFRSLDENAEVWIISFTREVFTSYEHFITKFRMYLEPQWTCRYTGKSGLTYEEALKSEEDAIKKLRGFAFTPAQIEHICRVIHHSVRGTEALVDQIYRDFNDTLFVGQSVLLVDKVPPSAPPPRVCPMQSLSPPPLPQAVRPRHRYPRLTNNHSR